MKWRLKVYPQGKWRPHRWRKDKTYFSAFLVPVDASDSVSRRVSMRMETIVDDGEDHHTTAFTYADFGKNEDGTWTDWGFTFLSWQDKAKPRKGTTLFVHIDRFFLD